MSPPLTSISPLAQTAVWPPREAELRVKVTGAQRWVAGSYRPPVPWQTLRRRSPPRRSSRCLSTPRRDRSAIRRWLGGGSGLSVATTGRVCRCFCKLKTKPTRRSPADKSPETAQSLPRCLCRFRALPRSAPRWLCAAARPIRTRAAGSLCGSG